MHNIHQYIHDTITEERGRERKSHTVFWTHILNGLNGKREREKEKGKKERENGE